MRDELWHAQTWRGIQFRFWMPEGAGHDEAWETAEEISANRHHPDDWLVMVTMAALTQFNDAPVLPVSCQG